MRVIPPLLLADLKKDTTSLAFLWAIEMADGRVIRGTEHDQDVVIPPTGDSPADKFAGRYFAVANVTMGDVASTSDLSVDNLEVSGAFAGNTASSPAMATVLDVTVADVESGLLDKAPVSVMICNWRDPSHGYFIVKSGYLGAINHDSDGKYTTEVRGLTQLLSQTIIRTFSATCNVVKFGDSRCKFNVANTASATATGVVDANSANNREQFEVSITPFVSPLPGYSFRGGVLTFTSGANAGFFREVKLDPLSHSNIVTFWDQFPEDVLPGDAFTISIGCDRQPGTCKLTMNNFVNWRGFGLFVPGVNAITAGPTTSLELQ